MKPLLYSGACEFSNIQHFYFDSIRYSFLIFSDKLKVFQFHHIFQMFVNLRHQKNLKVTKILPVFIITFFYFVRFVTILYLITIQNQINSIS